jgi:hypothetical protein
MAEDAVTSETVSPPDLPAIARFAGRISEIAGRVDPLLPNFEIISRA